MAEQVEVPPEEVVKALRSTELGKALWEAAYLTVLANAQAERIAQLERQSSAPTEPPGNGWEVPQQ